MRAILCGLVVVGSSACLSQPNAGCPVATSNPAFELAPYWVKYTKVSSTGMCGELTGEAIGFQKYNTPGTKEIRLSYRVQGIGEPFENGQIDPTDPEGTKINGFCKLPAIPAADNFCAATDFVAAEQSYEAIAGMGVNDGGTEIVGGAAALAIKVEFTSLKFLATVNAPGTLFTGELARTEGTCQTIYNTEGLWPQVVCDPAGNTASGYNLVCDPVANADAGHGLGSGINPTFALKGKPITCVPCSTCASSEDGGVAGNCQLTATLEDIAKL